MVDTTTIEITNGQKAELDQLKRADSESYKEVLQRLIDANSESVGVVDATQAREIATEVVTDRVVPEALE